MPKSRTFHFVLDSGLRIAVGQSSTGDMIAGAVRNVGGPVLLMQGVLSDVVSDESVRELVELIPHGQIVDVEVAGHMVPGDQIDRITHAVIDFLGAPTG